MHKAVAYSPDAMRTAMRVGLTRLGEQAPGYDAGAIVGAYSTVSGAVLVTVPPDGSSAPLQWQINKKGDGLVADGPLGALKGSFVAGI